FQFLPQKGRVRLDGRSIRGGRRERIVAASARFSGHVPEPGLDVTLDERREHLPHLSAHLSPRPSHMNERHDVGRHPALLIAALYGQGFLTSYFLPSASSHRR